MTGSISLHHWPLGLVSYLFCHAAHLLLWRAHRPRREAVALGALFFVPALLLWGLSESWGLAPCLLHCLLGANYIAIYPAFQASSPTITLLDFLYRHPEGVALSHLISSLAAPSLVQDRIEDLRRSGLVRDQGTTLTLSLSGNLIAIFFIRYRRWLGLSRGMG